MQVHSQGLQIYSSRLQVLRHHCTSFSRCQPKPPKKGFYFKPRFWKPKPGFVRPKQSRRRFVVFDVFLQVFRWAYTGSIPHILQEPESLLVKTRFLTESSANPGFGFLSHKVHCGLRPNSLFTPQFGTVASGTDEYRASLGAGPK